MTSRIEHLAEGISLYPGDCLDVLKTLDANSIDACVTDPPYGLEFMGKGWDGVEGFASSLARAGMSSPGIGKRETQWPSFYGGLNPKCRKCGKSQRGGSPCKCAEPDFPNERLNRAELFQQFSEAWAREVFRVLKPGAHLLSFGGTRTFHRMACAIEDAGFEIRDCCSWNFGSGFPKSRNVSKVLGDEKERCTCEPSLRSVRSGVEAAHALSGGSQQDVLSGVQCHSDIAGEQGEDQSATNAMRSMRKDDVQSSLQSKTECGGILQPVLPQQDVRGSSEAIRCEREGEASAGQGIEGRAQPGLEGRRDVPKAPGQLREREVCSLPAGADFNGTGGRLRDGASPSDGAMDRSRADPSGVRSPRRPSTPEQRADESGTVAMQPQPQKRGTWDHCGRCGKPIISDGLGTALKPAMELICLARKPLSESTIAANVLRWGTGALNIDGCRVATDESITATRNIALGSSSGGVYGTADKPGVYEQNNNGRWPANIIHDGSDEVVGAFPESESNAHSSPRESGRALNPNGSGQRSVVDAGSRNGFVDSGSAARFFYSAKADSDDRLGSKHPTVKPVDLLQYLVRLVGRKDALILDPFAGSGTTGEACLREGMRCILIERETEYCADIRRRMRLALSGPAERKREAAKAKTKDKPADHGPLFGGAPEQQGGAGADRYTATSPTRTNDRTNGTEVVNS